MLRSDLCDFSDACIVVKETIAVGRPNNANINKAITFKNNAPFINCISKIYGIKIDNAEDLDVVMPMYNLIEYSNSYKKKTTGSLWNYYRNEPTNSLSSNYESFKYKSNIAGNTYNICADEEGYDGNKVGKNDTEVVIPLKYLSNFWRILNIPLINCEVELILSWSKNSVLVDITRKNAQGSNSAIVPPAELEFKITDTKLYVPVVNLSKENNIKLLE